MSYPTRQAYPSDISDEEWAYVAPYLTLLPEDCGQRRHELREVFNAPRWRVRAGSPWRLMPYEFPPWAAVHQQGPTLDPRRGLRGDGAGLARPAAARAGRAPQPS